MPDYSRQICIFVLTKNNKIMQKPDYIIELEKQAGLALERLREDKFSKNLPFMLGELDLEGNQFYYEFANGDIAIAEFPENQKQHKFIRYLSNKEADNLREKYNLLPCLIYT
jgi:hypothetical protein